MDTFDDKQEPQDSTEQHTTEGPRAPGETPVPEPKQSEAPHPEEPIHPTIQQPPPKKSSSCLWIGALAGCLGLIILSILGIITAIAIPNILKAREQAQVTKCEKNLNDLAVALDAYASEHGGMYPKSLQEIVQEGKHLKEIPRCPAAQADTYSASYILEEEGASYTVFCKGNHHQKAGLVPNTPVSRNGEVSRAPLPAVSPPSTGTTPEPTPTSFPAGSLVVKCIENLNEVATACEAYKQDHDGRYPTTLIEMVPDYLDAIPACPAAGIDTYSASYTTTQAPEPTFTIACKGHYHSTEGIREDKKIHLERLLERGTVMIFVDSRKPNVGVPEAHRGNPQLALNLDYAFQISDFRILNDRVEASLSFNRAPFFCAVPFDAIYAMRSDFADEMVFFIEDAPKDMESALQAAALQAAALQKPPTKEDKAAPEKPVLKEVKPETGNPESGDPKNPKKKGHLRLIK
ncbi:MAG: hypothetical protein HYU64_00245 [Armatimonadetes bacterium]|nr:hypothetical protein [Armatimonadota bacterium]